MLDITDNGDGTSRRYVRRGVQQLLLPSGINGRSGMILSDSYNTATATGFVSI